ncbi:MAG: LAGLIDADG family homing endonuclease [Candidatus Micrarchaeia archaeon]|jgi:hypothetical protein
MKRKYLYWLIGLVDGDGYTNGRKIELYNSSPSILKEAVHIFKELGIPGEKIKADVYSSRPKSISSISWSQSLGLPLSSLKVRLNTSPWAERKEKVRLRVHSKKLVSRLISTKPSGLGYVKGLFDAEASVDIKGYIEFKQKARPKGMKITKSLHKILSSRGMSCTSVRTKNDRGLKNDVYFYVKNLEKFAKEVNFTDADKKRKLDILLKIRKHKTLPVPFELRTANGQSLWRMMDQFNMPYHALRRKIRNPPPQHVSLNRFS